MDRLDAIEHTYHGARDLQGEARVRFLDAQCGSDDSMRRQVEALLAQDDASNGLLNRPALDVAAAWTTVAAGPTLTGRKVGPYEVLELIGSGGMGDVYRARDVKLRRDVALKVLPPPLRSDPDRLSRFAREARSLAALNHPNIAAIYGFEEADEIHALALELVDGPTLADRVAAGALPLDEALAIAHQIAEALEAAHAQGMVHRDLKPANIKVRPDGTVKVLDFGLAKAIAGAAEDWSPDGPRQAATASPTMTSPALTRMGVLLGTAAYMSPEQAKGRPVDKRSDVWAFGCVLYEMLTGKRTFAGEDVSDTLAAVLRAEPDWTALPPSLSPAIVALIRGCLAKDWRRRIGDLSTARFIIDHGPQAQVVVRSSASRIRFAAWAGVVAVAAAAIAAYATWRLTAVPPPPLVARFMIALPKGVRFSNTGMPVVALSPDGSRLVYTANQRLYLRAMNQLEASPIPGTEGAGPAAGRGPFFSPDGQWVGFWAGGQIKKVSLTGGTPVALCAAEGPWGTSWIGDKILYGQSAPGAGKGGAGIWRVSSDGGKPEHLVNVEDDQLALGPQLLPGGRAILFTLVRRDDWETTAQVVVQSLDTGKRQVVLERGMDARYLPTGHLVYAIGSSRGAEDPNSRTLLAAPFDMTRLAVTGGAVPIAQDVAGSNATIHLAISSQGALAYVPSDAIEPRRQRTLVWVDRQGSEDPINADPHQYLYPRLSPDGTHIVLEMREQDNDVWIWDLARESLTRLTLQPTFEQYGVWTPDGRDVIFTSSQGGGPNSPRSLFRQRSDGTGTPEQLTQGAVAQFPSTVTPDGTALIFRQQTQLKPGAPPDLDLFILPLKGDRLPRPLVQTPFNELNAEVSPDGSWLAYQSNESGRDEIYVRPFPDVDAGKWPVSTTGGTQPLWARNRQELFYVTGRALMRVPFTGASTFVPGKPSQVLTGPYLLTLPAGLGIGRMYDVSPDGKRFLMLKELTATNDPVASPRIFLVQNWLEELKQRVPSK